MPTIEELNDSPRKQDNYDDWDDSPGQSQFVRDFLSTTWQWRVTSVCFMIGYLFHVISYGSPYWLSSDDATTGDVTYVGMWNRCQKISDCAFRNETTQCLLAVRCFGGFPVVTGLVNILLLYYYIGNHPHRRRLLITVVVFCAMAALSMQICSATLIRTTACMSLIGTPRLSWALLLSLLAFLLTSATGLSFLIHEVRACGLFKTGNPPKNLGLKIT